MTQTLLVELLTEELPPKALARLGEAFAAGIVDGLQSRGFLEPQALATAYATPRRLAVSITHVRATSPDRQLCEKVLPVAVALDANGNASPPLLKKLAVLAAATGVDMIAPAQLERAVDGKAESFFYRYTARGTGLQAALQAALEDSIAKLPIPKVMSYQRPDGSTVQFVRPVHGLIALHGEDILELTALGLQAGRTTLGHRFLSAGVLTIGHAEHYADVLEKGHVVPGAAARKERIRAALLAQAGEDTVLMPESLLDEVAALVEWPVVYACTFEEQFLKVPQECLILTMQTNQKYFAVTDVHGRLRSRFLIVSNLATDDPRHIIEGNERVVRPRLSDAKFFYEQDQKKTLEARLPGLQNVVYHNKLGTQGERTRRVVALAVAIATALEHDTASVAMAERAARLAKTDLLTDMVGEFPELQGIMGTYYAQHDGEPPQVACAIAEHYQPRYAGDALPASRTGTVVALADKLETLVGIWGIGLQPTGDKDPFALRRHALGILRMLTEKRLPLSLPILLASAAMVFADNPAFADPSTDVQTFLYDRLRGLLRERGFAPHEIEAVVAPQPETLDTLLDRLDAVRPFAALPESQSLAAANKRIANILKKATTVPSEVDTTILATKGVAQEQALHQAMTMCAPEVDRAFAAGDFQAALTRLAALRAQVDRFFEEVMVNADDPQLRDNRLALLAQLHTMMNRVADISKLAT
ncbi:MAG: glycine--tRNA ligase subunit beta [Pseudomonadota bacterium]